MDLSQDKPTALPVIQENIPDELKTHNQFVCWKYKFQPSKDKWTKPPFQVTGEFASVTNPDTWDSFDRCWQAYTEGGKFDGIGFVLTQNDPFVCVDLDHCKDSDFIEPFASEIIAQFQSYTEISPSGSGIHIFGKGKLPSKGHNGADVEVYDDARYVTLTGHTL